MHAQIGDRLIVEGDPARTALIIGVPHEDGSPPYIVKWLANGTIAMVSPGEFARITAGDEGESAPEHVPAGQVPAHLAAEKRGVSDEHVCP